MKELAYIDGTFIDLKEYAVQLEDRGYQLGDGVYETLRVYDGVCFGVKKHLERYRNSMRALNIPITDTDEELYNLFNEMIQKTEIKDGLIYFQLARGTAPRSLQSPYPSLPHLNVIIRDTPINTEWQENGIRAALVEDIRWLRCDINSLNLLGNVVAMDQAVKANGATALLYRKDANIITEGVDANFFVVKEGILWTHPKNNLILPGVTRELIMERLSKQLDLTVVEKAFKPEFAYSAEEAFLTNTENEIVPVKAIDRNTIADGNPGEITKSLQKAYRELVKKGIDMDENE